MQGDNVHPLNGVFCRDSMKQPQISRWQSSETSSLGCRFGRTLYNLGKSFTHSFKNTLCHLIQKCCYDGKPNAGEYGARPFIDHTLDAIGYPSICRSRGSHSITKHVTGMDHVATMCEDANEEVQTNCDTLIVLKHWQCNHEVGGRSHDQPTEGEAVAIPKPPPALGCNGAFQEIPQAIEEITFLCHLR
mmetsp:Transcript_4224/g.7806  ORF Transcript_4224/g.7806 Transcript_4224/m.7806 type:complete len:189 (+) Transcript_4224:879-1445(+)